MIDPLLHGVDNLTESPTFSEVVFAVVIIGFFRLFVCTSKPAPLRGAGEARGEVSRLTHHLVEQRDFLGFCEGLEVGEKFDFSRVFVRPLGEEGGGCFGCFGFGG